MKKWTSFSGYTSLTDARGVKIRDLNPNTVIEATGEFMQRLGSLFEHVVIDGVEGWVESRKVELYTENYPRNCVDLSGIQTPDTHDFEQYVYWHKKKQVNLCGPISACYILGISLSEMLERWEIKKPTFWRSVFGDGIARGTGEGELVSMLELFDVKAQTLQPRYKVYTPDLLSYLIGSIVGVKMSTATGRLNGGGVGHWVVVTDVLNERSGYGLVYIYNPAPNCIEVYSYAEFLASARVPFGAIKV
jgi:hypothetical protein